MALEEHDYHLGRGGYWYGITIHVFYLVLAIFSYDVIPGLVFSAGVAMVVVLIDSSSRPVLVAYFTNPDYGVKYRWYATFQIFNAIINLVLGVVGLWLYFNSQIGSTKLDATIRYWRGVLGSIMS